ncbi:MAG: phosphoglycerate kinase [Parcubacteria group bacterium]|nr:phosphoglycerate kinase [Parcubacteria group bacterium]MCR4342963.1 phosphoglycerate kinase [Patescibacteria group bacterium]
MKLPSIKQAKNLKGKKVLLRGDLNVFIEDGEVKGDFRIKQILPTIRFLKKNGAKVIILSHVTKGRAAGLLPVAEYINSYFKVDFSREVLGSETREKINNMKNGGVLLLENLRSDDREKNNDTAFAKELASLGDIYVNDAFSVSHRKHASIVGLPKFLPSYSGLLMDEEVSNLSKAFKSKHPFLLILGGVKFESKLGVLKRFIKTADKIFIGGALANVFLKEKGIDIGKSIYDKDVDIKKFVKSKKIVIPKDMLTESGINWDIGTDAIKELKEIISKSKFVIWSGPLGNFEGGYKNGTTEIAKAIAKSKAISIVGGGDTISAIKKLNILNKFSFVSTGGGAMLAFLSEGTLPGIEALKKKKK